MSAAQPIRDSTQTRFSTARCCRNMNGLGLRPRVHELMALTIQLYRRPNGDVSHEIIQIARLLTERWFTANVPEDTRRDLLFQDVFCLYEDGQLRSFLVFTNWDGSLQSTLMGTHPRHQGRGFGSLLVENLFHHTRNLGFDRVVALSVPADVKPVYRATIAL